MTAVTTGNWWDAAVVYQVYPRSFADGNGDGIGDLAGLLWRLPYIASLGVDAIWVTPFQPSPQVDQGYDVSDYCGVDPLFGSMTEFEQLLECCHSLGLRVLLDVVPNHCSSAHPLFRQALAAGPGSPEREMFHFTAGSHDGLPPNNWQSVFGGDAWTRASPDSPTDKDWYLHLFSSAQPDWNWRNPAVGDFFEAVLRFWFDKGVDGLRVDVAHALFKADGLPSAPAVTAVVDGLRSNPLASDQEDVHQVYRRWRHLAQEYAPHRLLVGEVNLAPARAARYTRADEMHQAFPFAFIGLGWDADSWARVGNELENARQTHGAAPTWALETHDLVRSATRYGGGVVGSERARAALLAILGLPGAAYLYQGQELGLPEVDVPEAERVDPMWSRGGVCRDGARIPLPWTRENNRSHGFSQGETPDAPWLPVPEGWGEFAVEQQHLDPDSTLQLVVRAVELRKKLTASGVFGKDDDVSWAVQDGGLLLCRRQRNISIAIAMGSERVRLPAGEVLISARPLDSAGWLEPGNSAWIVQD